MTRWDTAVAHAAARGLAEGMAAAATRLQGGARELSADAIAAAIGDEIRAACVAELRAVLDGLEAEYFAAQLQRLKASRGI